MNKQSVFVALELQRWVLLSTLVLCSVPAIVFAAGVAMVTDLQGKPIATSQGRSRELGILDEIAAGETVQLGTGAMIVTLYLDSGDEYVVKGPSSIEFRAGGPESVNGAKPERRKLALGKGGEDVRIKSIGMVQGAMVMRGARSETRIEPLSMNGTRTLETKPEFRWTEVQPGLIYAFEVADEAGRQVIEREVKGTSITLPASVKLKEGAPYTWKVSTRLPDGKTYSRSAEFSIASAEIRSEAAALRPAASAPLSTRIAYAAWLDQLELKDEARKYWKAVSAERPDSAKLKLLAEQ